MKVYYAFAILLLLCKVVAAQDPKLPATNLGLSNLQDGNPPGTGWYYQQYIQNYQTISNRGPSGAAIGNGKVNSLLSMSQLIHIGKTKMAGGNLGFTVLLPVVRLSAENNRSQVPTVNPNPLGDIIAGPFVQWFNKKLLGMRYSHRLELDLVSPIGAYQSLYDVNPGAHLFSVVPHYTFTIFPSEKFSVSMRHHFNYYFNELGTRTKPGVSYNFNYSLEYALTSSLRVELAGYYLKQLAQDSENGDSHYYQEKFGISDTRERVFAYGPGIGYVTPSGLFIELKEMQEAAAKNRSEGFRTTLVLSYKLDK
ncbi:transporter [uncultured Mucilaginibacter sp.]|uniref:SphA family protein n=1 Tax=uncultured Mucilaginibacter sp. TaxID=797541 RepID=UPI0026209918|nr:transporter [uncultured Mucilaginibacter sp.]